MTRHAAATAPIGTIAARSVDDGTAGGPATLAFAIFAGVGLLMTFFAGDWYVAKVIAIAGMVTSLVVGEWRRVGHPLTPVGILGLGSLLVFVLRPLTVLSTGVTTAGAALDSRSVDPQVLHAGSTALSEVVLFLATLGLTYLVRIGRTAGIVTRRRDQVATDAQIRIAGQILTLTLIPALVCTYLLVSSSGGVTSYVHGLSVRSSFLTGRYYLTLGYLPGSVALCVYLVLRQGRAEARRSLGVVLAAAIVLASAFTGGGRGPLLLGVVLPLLIVKQSGRRPLRTPSLILAGIAVVAGGMLMSILLRDNIYTSGKAVQDLRRSPVAALGERLTNGAETRPFDSLIVLNQAAESGHLEWQHGRTYAATVKWVLPSAIAGAKGGGNTWFTSTYVPRYYYPDHVETSLSAPGEAYANFGWAGVALVGAMTGAVAAGFSRAMAGRRGVGLVLNAKLAPAFFSFLRGDAYQNAALAVLTALLAYAIYRIAMRDRSLR